MKKHDFEVYHTIYPGEAHNFIKQDDEELKLEKERVKKILDDIEFCNYK